MAANKLDFASMGEQRRIGQSDLDRLVSELNQTMKDTRDELKALRSRNKASTLWVTIAQILAPIALAIAAASFGFAWNLNARVIRMEEGPPTVQEQILRTLQDHESRIRSLEHVHREVGGPNGEGN